MDAFKKFPHLTTDQLPTHKLRKKCVPYSGDSSGYCSEIVIVTVDTYNGRDSDVKEFWWKKKAVKKLLREISDSSHPPTVYSAYDCTGKPFGSRWERLDAHFNEWGLCAVYLHTWSVDI